MGTHMSIRVPHQDYTANCTFKIMPTEIALLTLKVTWKKIQHLLASILAIPLMVAAAELIA